MICSFAKLIGDPDYAILCAISNKSSKWVVKRIFRKVQFLSHVAIILIAFLIGFVVIKQYVLSPPDIVSSTPTKIVGSPDKPTDRTTSSPTTPIGKTIPIEGVDWKAKKQTLVLYLSTTCRYCNESVPFYQRLVKEKSRQGFEMVAILSQSPDEARSYLSTHALSIGQVFSSSLSSVGVTSTPTLLLVNQDGVVSNSWRGKLSPDKEAEVLSKLSS
jgi:peroxiredoxin